MKRFIQMTVMVTASSLLVLPAFAGEQGSKDAGKTVAQEVVFADFSHVNDGLMALGIRASLEKIEYLTVPGSGERGRTVLARDRGNKQLNLHWVPGDPRRGGFMDISYAVDLAEGGTGSGLTSTETEAAIDRAMQTWQGVTCSDLDLIKHNIDPTLDVGIVEHILGFDGKPYLFADVTHAGWQPPEFFDAVTPGGGDYILAGTYTFIWIDRFGSPTDVNNDGKADVAFKEIYYNDDFSWSDDVPSLPPGSSDVESVALHEMGHGLSQGHFGDIFFDASGRHTQRHFHVAPRAVMNAISGGTQRVLLGTDVGGHCSIWGTWPDQ